MIRAVKLASRTSLRALAVLLLIASAPAGDAQMASTKTSIPKIACIGKIQIGCSTQEDLARHWGEGKTITGGHPNSGRLWRVKGTPWVLHADGFEYSKRGLVVDGLDVYEDLKAGADAPYAKLAKSDFAWCGGIWPGMSQQKVMQILKRKSLRITLTQDGCEICAKGFYALQSSMDPLRTWTARLIFTNGSLSQLTLAAGFK